MSVNRGDIRLREYQDSESYGSAPPHNETGGDYKPLDIARSHDVQYLQITIPNEILNDAIHHLGECGRLHVVDISKTSSGDVSKYIFAYKKRCTDLNDLEKKLKSFEDQCRHRGVHLDVSDFSRPLGPFGDQLLARNPDLIVGAGEYVTEVESRLLNNIAFERNVQQEIARRAELSVTLEAAARLVPQSISKVQENSAQQGANTYESYMSGNGQLQGDDDVEAASGPLSSYTCGVIPVDNLPMFTKLVYRTAKGSNAVVRFEPINELIVDPATGQGVKKAVFCVATIGRQLFRRINKLCPLVNATVYPITTFDPAFVSSERSRLEGEIQEQKLTLERTSNEIRDILAALAAPQVIDGIFGPCQLFAWQQLLFIEKVMISVLMKCSFHATFVVLGAWVPTEFLDDVIAAVEHCAEQGGSNGAKPLIDYNTAPSWENETPPTYIPTTEFTNSFQALVNTYGIPTYKEFNPALVAIATFPFIFGVMFGDVGHGLLLLLFSIFLISQEKNFEAQRRNKTMNEMVDMIYSSRYFLVLMSVMAIYNGFIYNDFMANPMNIFGRQFNQATGKWDGVYPFGMDPSWYHQTDSLKFFNSFKMKMAVILGIIHMLSGMFISLLNHIHFNDMVSIVFEFIPRLLFLLCTFGWMITMIVIKWCIDWDDVSRGSQHAPSLVQTMINMFLAPGSAIPKEAQLIPGQAGFQTVLVLIAVIMVPIMWFAKPIIEFNKMKKPFLPMFHSPIDDERVRKQAHQGHAQDDQLLTHLEGHVGHDDRPHHEEHTFGDVIVHHSIHTIEYILGCVSNTASYLRLWALSLAHAQLSEVFWSKMMTDYGFMGTAPGQAFAGCAVWCLATLGVIVVMDSLEVFLHTLRLHWVESMNKHYMGTGILMKFFNFTDESQLE